MLPLRRMMFITTKIYCGDLKPFIFLGPLLGRLE
jgi:hypothetical protein